MSLSLLSSFHKFLYSPRTFTSPMNLREAGQILNGPNIMDRYKELMKINHPDVGGSKYIAEKINEALNLMKERFR